MGETYIWHDNLWVQFTMHQILALSKVMIENSAFWLGDKMFTELLGPVMDKHLNHYKHTFTQRSLIEGQMVSDDFTIDFRNVHDPYVTTGYIDFRFLGAISSHGHVVCENFDPDYMWWHGTHVES